MYLIERADYGYHLTFSGVFTEDENRRWLEESRRILAEGPGEFGVFVDMRTCQPLSYPARKILEAGQRYYKEMGMTRSVVIVDSPVLKRQLEELAKQSGIYEWERYIATSTTPRWEKVALDWIIKAVDPDRKEQPVSR